jgi:hypothetical protein
VPVSFIGIGNPFVIEKFVCIYIFWKPRFVELLTQFKKKKNAKNHDRFISKPWHASAGKKLNGRSVAHGDQIFGWANIDNLYHIMLN